MKGAVREISWPHFLAVAAGALCIAFAPILVVWAHREGGVGMMDAAFWRVAIGALALALLPGRKVRPVGEGRRIETWMWFPGVLLAADLAVWHVSFAHTSVANATLLANFSLVLVSLFAWMVWRERITAPFVMGALMAGAGGGLLIWSSARGGEVVPGGNPVLGDVLGLATAFFYAGYLLTTKGYRRSQSTRSLMLWSSSVAALTLIPWVSWHPDPLWPATAQGWWALVALGVVSHAGGQGLIAYGLGGVPATLAAITLLLQPMGTAVLGVFLLGQPLAAAQCVGGVLVLAGLAWAVRARG